MKDGGWAITESDVVTDSLYKIEATKSQNNKSLRLTIYIDKDTPGKLSIIITVRCSGVEL